MNIDEAPREIRRAAYALERAQRGTGKWSPWLKATDEQLAAAYRRADATFGGYEGWVRDVHTAWTNGWCCVSVRTIPTTALGVAVDHAFIRTAMNDELCWKEKQRIKEELFGLDRMAVEVFPRTDDLVDAADMYHLWLFPEGYRFDFGLGKGQQ